MKKTTKEYLEGAKKKDSFSKSNIDSFSMELNMQDGWARRQRRPNSTRLEAKVHFYQIVPLKPTTLDLLRD